MCKHTPVLVQLDDDAASGAAYATTALSSSPPLFVSMLVLDRAQRCAESSLDPWDRDTVALDGLEPSFPCKHMGVLFQLDDNAEMMAPEAHRDLRAAIGGHT